MVSASSVLHLTAMATEDCSASLLSADGFKLLVQLRWLLPVLHFPEPLNFTKGFLAHHDGLVPVLARWCY